MLIIKVIQTLYYLLNMSFDGDGPAGLAWNISWGALITWMIIH